MPGIGGGFLGNFRKPQPTPPMGMNQHPKANMQPMMERPAMGMAKPMINKPEKKVEKMQFTGKFKNF